MPFNSILFLLFFPAICIIYYILPGRLRNIYLLLASIGFYILWKPIFALFLLWVIVATYFFAHLLRNHNRITLWAGVIVTLLPLAFFKYYNFACRILEDIAHGLGDGLSLPGLNWAIPVGISFYTFQALGYLVDVWQNKVKPESNFLHHALFISFFPQILSGPISRYSYLMPQIKMPRKHFNGPMILRGVRTMVWGMFLKVCVADRFGLFVDTIYGHPEEFSGLTVFVAVICYSIQIYTDFAGYSLLAIGSANILGFKIKDNFLRPYFSFGFSEFWKRWHISLSFWLRDYVYIPLGGGRVKEWRVRRNLLVTFLISGLWHGAAYTYLLWGLIHGVLVVADRWLRPYKARCNRWCKAAGIALTFLFASFLWILFRVSSIKEAANIIEHIFTDRRLLLQIPDNRDMKATVLTMCIMGAIVLAKEIAEECFVARKHSATHAFIYSLIIVMAILLFGVFDAGQFIYISF